ncbi:LacI family DNA-binding transcriptional regulator [Modestobacter sp. VKM Ac-2986]|uniref:LacI family DNA-binding transcriptional regulator n=1 Tax=Modestobacter sp. VKM Ac-2986 TaxID=3004140 RepID=UPI0022AAC905|nr:LacI family DNA-binding transcriptional regulator [Modestobacter sp. VKM Ac-2986]MCZ2828631.1 LacI family DNA-binding transcriptional regulator [Modestobacter sp. VKM Ac-2986]
MPRVTSADVARESGVSRTTVSYVLNDTSGTVISEETRRRVREAADRLGYAPSAAARTLRSGRSDLVLCVVPDWPVGPVMEALLDHLTRELAARDLSVLVHHSRGQRPLADLWRAVTPRAVVGFTAFPDADEVGMRRAGIQVVATVLDEEPRRPGAFAVGQLQVGRLQAQHLVGAGHRVIGYASTTDPRLAEFADPRLAGVREECRRLGLPDPRVHAVELTAESGRAAVRALRAGLEPASAIAAYNDEVALAVLAGARAEGLRVPDDVAVIGVDDVTAARLAAPPLTTVSQSAAVQARFLSDSVTAALDGRPPPAHPDDVLRLVVRESA